MNGVNRQSSIYLKGPGCARNVKHNTKENNHEEVNIFITNHIIVHSLGM